MKKITKINGIELGPIWIDEAEDIPSGQTIKGPGRTMKRKKMGDLSHARMVSYGLAIVKKPYPKRLDLSGFIERIIWNKDTYRIGPIEARELIVKYIQNNYRRRRKSA